MSISALGFGSLFMRISPGYLITVIELSRASTRSMSAELIILLPWNMRESK